MAVSGERARKRVQALAWIFLYGGLFLAGIGVAVLRNGDPSLGWLLVAFGIVDALTGAFLIWYRSRMSEQEPVS